MKRVIIVALEIFIFYIIQSSMSRYISLMGIMPNLMLILVVSTAYMRGQTDGLLVGFFSGIIIDFIFGGVIGLSAFLYMIIGYFIGFLNRFYSKDDFTLPVFFVAISNLFFGIGYYVFTFLLRGRLYFGYYLTRFILPEMVYTVAVSVFLYKLLHMIHHRLYSRKAEED